MEQAEVDSILSREHKLERLVIDKFNIDYTYSKIQCLRLNTWINDECINFYMQLLQQRDAMLCLSGKKDKPSLFMNCFFMAKLLENKIYRYDLVKKWTIDKKQRAAGRQQCTIVDMENVFVPINIHNRHWALLVIGIQCKHIQFYDSMYSASKCTYYLDTAKQWLSDEYSDKVPNATRETAARYAESFRRSYGNGPQQDNGNDCGVYTIMTADYLSDNLPLVFSDKDMPTFRCRIVHASSKGILPY